MKNILTIICITAIIGAGYFYFIRSAPIKNYPSSGKNIIAFGDSLVQGVGSTQGNDFVSLLSKKIDTPIVNMGVSGNTTADALARLDSVVEKEPKVVLVLVGGNDFLRHVPADETFHNLETIITRIQGAGSIVVLLGIRGGILSDTYQSEFKGLASKYQTAYVPDVLDGLLGNKEFMSDAIHPNNLGYQKIADKVYPILIPLLK